MQTSKRLTKVGPQTRESWGVMSRENIELVREFLDAVTRRDLSRLIALSDPEVEWRSFFAIGEEGGVYRGHDAMPQYITSRGCLALSGLLLRARYDSSGYALPRI